MSKQQFLDEAGLVQYDGLIQHKIDEHVNDNYCHVSTAEKNDWNGFNARLSSLQNYSYISFGNYGTNAIASEPTTGESDNSITISPHNNSDRLKILAGNKLVLFDVVRGASSGVTDKVIVSVNADPSGSADKALTSAKSYTDQKVADLVDSAPTTLDTLGEVATAIKEHQSVTDALDAAIGNKANKTDLSSHTGNVENPHKVTKNQIGLGNVDNTSDLNKPISTAMQKALDGKAPSDHAHSYLPLSGGTLTGNLTGKYISGTWLQTTAASNGKGNFATLDGSGWIYYRTPTEVLTDIGAAPAKHTHNYAGSSSAGGSADSAIKDGSGNIITDIYATKDETAITVEDIDEIWGQVVAPIMVLNSTKLDNAVLL